MTPDPFIPEEIRAVTREQDRWIRVACAFLLSPTSRNRRGINKTDWIPIDRDTHEKCLDKRDYRNPPPGTGGDG